MDIESRKRAEKAKKQLNDLTAGLAIQGARLLLDADSTYHQVDTVFSDIPVGKWLLVGISESGGIVYHTITKEEPLPIFIEFGDKEFKDVSDTRYSDREQELLKKREETRLKKQQAELRAIREEEAKKRQLEKQQSEQQAKQLEEELKKLAGANPGQKTPERLLRGLVFFAELRNNLNAFGGRVKSISGQAQASTVDGVRAIRFNGSPSQGIAYQWNCISGNNPRSVSVWFYCAGYNRHDGGNAILSYGTKNFGTYWDIETNRSRILGWAWDTIQRPLAQNIQNNRWNHFVITYDGNTRICYLNGEVSSTEDIRLNTTATPLMIGTRLNDTNHCFVGNIRNVAIYNRALSRREVEFLRRVNLKKR